MQMFRQKSKTPVRNPAPSKEPTTVNNDGLGLDKLLQAATKMRR